MTTTIPPYASFQSEGTYTPPGLIYGNSDDLVALPVTLAAGAGTLMPGAVLGKITASGNYSLSASTANDGSQIPDCLLADTITLSASPQGAMAYFRGDFNVNTLSFGAGHSLATVRDTLRTKGIFLLSGVKA